MTLAGLDATERLVRPAGGRLSFRHPLIRSAAYQDAPLSLRLAAHRALADALDDDPERRAWHLAAAPERSADTRVPAAGDAGRTPQAGTLERVLQRLESMPDADGRYTHIVLVSLPDQVEAAVRQGEPERAIPALERFSAWSEQVDLPWAHAVTLRCRAQLSPSPDSLYTEALLLHEEGGRPFERAHTKLLYGEWLRRSRRRADARAPLRSAANLFHRLGALPWAERAKIELRATGERLARDEQGPDVLRSLTTQELHVVRLAATGMTNRDIAGQLFLSPRTVGYHLHKALPKLGVASRNELARLLPEELPL